MNSDDNELGNNGTASPSPPGTTFDYHVTVEWAGNIERHTLNRIGEICDVVAGTLADMGVIDGEEPPDPNIARITIERAGAPSIHDLPKTELPGPKADAGKGA